VTVDAGAHVPRSILFPGVNVEAGVGIARPSETPRQPREHAAVASH